MFYCKFYYDTVHHSTGDERGFVRGWRRLESADRLYVDTADLSEAAASKARQAYTDTLKTLSDVESLQTPTTVNVSHIQDVANDIKQQVDSLFNNRRSACIDPEVKRSKVKVTRLGKPSQLHGC